MKFSELTIIVFTALRVGSADGQHIRSGKTRESIENDTPFWSRELLNEMSSMVDLTPTPAPAEHSFVPSLGFTSRTPETIDPSAAPTTPPDSLNVIEIASTDLLYTDILMMESYTMFCQEEEYTSVQIVTSVNTVYCVTNFEGAAVAFGYEEDYPDRPMIKLDIDPPLECASGTIPDAFKNYCGFAGMPSFMSISHEIHNLDYDGMEIDGKVEDLASYTTYCVEDEYTNVQMVGFNGEVVCLATTPGAPVLIYSEEVIIDLEPPLSCEGKSNISSSFACGFTGVPDIVYPNFELLGNNTGNVTIL